VEAFYMHVQGLTVNFCYDGTCIKFFFAAVVIKLENLRLMRVTMKNLFWINIKKIIFEKLFLQQIFKNSIYNIEFVSMVKF
jgi:hypothetical protein